MSCNKQALQYFTDSTLAILPFPLSSFPTSSAPFLKGTVELDFLHIFFLFNRLYSRPGPHIHSQVKMVSCTFSFQRRPLNTKLEISLDCSVKVKQNLPSLSGYSLLCLCRQQLHGHRLGVDNDYADTMSAKSTTIHSSNFRSVSSKYFASFINLFFSQK